MLDVVVPCGFALEGVASKVCFITSLRSESVEIIPNVWCGPSVGEDIKL